MVIKLLTIITLTIFSISGCKDKIICAEIKSAEIKPVVLYDVSFTFKRCRVRCFDANKWTTLPISSCPVLSAYASDYAESVVNFNELDLDTKKINFDAVNLPLEQCEGVAGFSLEDHAKEIGPKVKELNQIKVDNCR